MDITGKEKISQLLPNFDNKKFPLVFVASVPFNQTFVYDSQTWEVICKVASFRDQIEIVCSFTDENAIIVLDKIDAN